MKRIICSSLLVMALLVPQAAFADSTQETSVLDQNQALMDAYQPKIEYGEAPEIIDFGGPSDSSKISAADSSIMPLASVGYATYATGETKVTQVPPFGVEVSGTTKGKKLTAITSATASIWKTTDLSGELLYTGNEANSLGYGTANSEFDYYFINVSGISFKAITVHSVAYDFALYSAKTAYSFLRN
ncbi:hypothetical protein DFQ01_11091 [Paenibacillus cellulosilyticus]|uniref:Uncharacterized protein n=1 Tax=Paenibacillus cellulosilyticus TaxID=375489 RepID=A0A2V2YT46_9BACL|nr:hypothetical protein [Paenibacillus cellulosilyticus]PWW01201.1 hypothetical protein DFQ01_11091 [Paenibacillus cellulosilyticus]QKS46844.1 hypothetical protein HUB94_20385 [Paenibacillus cellulosilyticus]